MQQNYSQVQMGQPQMHPQPQQYPVPIGQPHMIGQQQPQMMGQPYQQPYPQQYQMNQQMMDPNAMYNMPQNQMAYIQPQMNNDDQKKLEEDMLKNIVVSQKKFPTNFYCLSCNKPSKTYTKKSYGSATWTYVRLYF